MKILTSVAIKIYAILHKFSTRITDKNALQSLIQKLYPIYCNKELIRLGPNGDGGYLVPNDLQNIEACFSPGVSDVSGFEKDCAGLGMKVFLADKSVEQPVESDKLFNFTRKFIGVTSNDDFMTLDNWVATSLPESHSDLLLQMDIEGYEYEVILSMSDNLMNRIRIFVVEFHHLEQLWNKPFFSLAARAFEKILQTHTCVHIHPNNHSNSLQIGAIEIPRIMEFTFFRNDRIATTSYQHIFPHSLDYDNSDAPTLTLPTCWYRWK